MTEEKKAPEVKTVQRKKKQFKFFQIMLADNIKAKLEKKLKVKEVTGVEDIPSGVKDIPSFLLEILKEKSPPVQFIEEIELAEQLLSLYKDAAKMYSVIDNPSDCEDGYNVCTLNGQTTCCRIPVMMSITTKKGSTNHAEDMIDTQNDKAFLYWNCNVTIYQTINSNNDCKKIEVEEVLLRPKDGIKILDLNKFNKIKTIHFGAPYDIFIDM